MNANKNRQKINVEVEKSSKAHSTQIKERPQILPARTNCKTA